ncbi:MAG: GNAT family N-acetyltransferase [Desulfobacteraceae bacterium]|jgi:N-acetylglutamate synthase-like GNAT family acetyltransferase
MYKRIELKDKQVVSIRTDIHPGDIGSIIYLHGTLYAKEYGFDHTFEPYVAIPLSEFVNKQTSRDKLWIVEKKEKVVGSVAILSCPGNIAQLRWLIVHPDLRGYGIGKKLVKEALSFCRTQKYASVFLWTIDFLDAAVKIYTSAGFRVTESKIHNVWGRRLTEERYELRLNPD